LAAVLLVVAWTAVWLGNAVWLQSHGWSRSFELWAMVVVMFLTIAWGGLRLTESNLRTSSDKDSAQ
jgi:hypothetical protein